MKQSPRLTRDGLTPFSVPFIRLFQLSLPSARLVLRYPRERELVMKDGGVRMCHVPPPCVFHGQLTESPSPRLRKSTCICHPSPVTAVDDGTRTPLPDPGKNTA